MHGKISAAYKQFEHMRFAVVGHPLDHSRSPAIFKAAFEELGLAHSYVKEDVSPEKLLSLIDKVRTGEYSGLSITVPYKEEIMRYLDELSTEAKAIKAVNTVYLSNGKVTGDNTDWIGFKKAFSESIDDKGKKILLCGAGGAARACLYALRDRKDDICLTNRNEEKGRKLANEFEVSFAPQGSLPPVDIIVNATSSGLYGDLPVSSEYLKNARAVFDLFYGNSPLIETARKSGIFSVDGSSMLLYQGAEQFKRFTGSDAPVEAMRKVL
jgi:shikimate dehydrogenase